ncbi:MAG: hypothetical protein K6B13_06950 [Prevotella sp.]|nr:hypothetical protein [Prevotella sp.]
MLNFGDGESIQNGIGHTVIAEKAGAWFDLNGRQLNGKPVKKGLYIVDGKKVVVK